MFCRPTRVPTSTSWSASAAPAFRANRTDDRVQDHRHDGVGRRVLAEPLRGRRHVPANDGLYEVFDKRFRSRMIGIARLEKLADGCLWAEGPVWFADGGYLLWSDIPNNRMLRWMQETGVTTFRAESNNSNG